MAGTREARRLARAGQRAGALRVTAELLAMDGECPYLLVLRSRLIQLDESDASLTPADAEKCLLAAIDVDPKYIQALEDLAHYYDAVDPDPSKARVYAQRFIEQVRTPLEKMQRIVGESPVGDLVGN